MTGDTHEDYTPQHADDEGSFLSDKAYDAIKYLVTLVLPAFATFYLTVGQLLELPATDKVVGVIVALGTFLGALINIAGRKYTPPTDGRINVVDFGTNEEGVGRANLNFNFKQGRETLLKDTVLLKVNQVEPPPES